MYDRSGCLDGLLSSILSFHLSVVATLKLATGSPSGMNRTSGVDTQITYQACFCLMKPFDPPFIC